MLCALTPAGRVSVSVTGPGSEPKVPVPGIAADERSLALRLELRDDSQTLTDERIDSVVAGVLAALESRLGVRLRAQ